LFAIDSRKAGEVYVMLEIIVGIIGVVLIIYLLVTILRPELF